MHSNFVSWQTLALISSYCVSLCCFCNCYCYCYCCCCWWCCYCSCKCCFYLVARIMTLFGAICCLESCCFACRTCDYITELCWVESVLRYRNHPTKSWWWWWSSSRLPWEGKQNFISIENCFSQASISHITPLLILCMYLLHATFIGTLMKIKLPLIALKQQQLKTATTPPKVKSPSLLALFVSLLFFHSNCHCLALF